MSKQITTGWYIGAWLVCVIAFVALRSVMQDAGSSTSPPASALISNAVLAISIVVMLGMWIAALLTLGTQRAWGWFGAVLVLHLIALGIIGMVAYAVWGPEDGGEVVMRPTMT